MRSITSYGSTYCPGLDQLIACAFGSLGYSLVTGNPEQDAESTSTGLPLAKTLAGRRIPNSSPTRNDLSVGLATVLSITPKRSHPLGTVVGNRERSEIMKRLNKKDMPVTLALGVAIRTPKTSAFTCSRVQLGGAEIEMTIDHVPNPTETGQHGFWTAIGNALRIADPDSVKKTLTQIASQTLPRLGT